MKIDDQTLFTGHWLSFARLFLAVECQASARSMVRIFLDGFNRRRFRNDRLMIRTELVVSWFDEILAWQTGIGCGRADAGLLIV